MRVRPHRRCLSIGKTDCRHVFCHVKTFFHLAASMRCPIQRIQGTAIELPSALYRGPSAAGLLRLLCRKKG